MDGGKKRTRYGEKAAIGRKGDEIRDRQKNRTKEKKSRERVRKRGRKRAKIRKRRENGTKMTDRDI